MRLCRVIGRSGELCLVLAWVSQHEHRFAAREVEARSRGPRARKRTSVAPGLDGLEVKRRQLAVRPRPGGLRYRGRGTAKQTRKVNSSRIRESGLRRRRTDQHPLSLDEKAPPRRKCTRHVARHWKTGSRMTGIYDTRLHASRGASPLRARMTWQYGVNAASGSSV